MSTVALPLAFEPPVPARRLDPAIAGPRDIRAVRTLRISVTDRCNFRCVYCMPEDKLDWLPRDEILTFEEIADVVRVATTLGIRGFKITGGEPLVRHRLPDLVRTLRRIGGVEDLSMTTNGALLVDHAAELRRAGLDRITISLDTLNPDRFRSITRGADLRAVLAGIAAAQHAGFTRVKINCVVMRGINDDELDRFAALTLEHDWTVRFIEYMPLGRTALGGEYERRFIPRREIQAAIERMATLEPVGPDVGHGPAVIARLPGAKGRVGFISAMSQPFCSTCNRLRLTAAGQLRSCLFDGGEIELRPMLRSAAAASARNAALRDAFVRCVAYKPDVHDYHGNRQMSQIGG